MIINTLGASGLWYTATVVNVPYWVHTRVCKVIWDFLWNGKTEHVKCDTCRLPRQHRGLSVINPLEKSRALKLKWVPPVGDSTCDKKWVYFTRYWIGFPLSRRMKNWAFIRSNVVPKHLGDEKPPIYQTILTAVDRIGVHFDLLSDHSVKTFYLRLTPPPLPPSGCLALSGGNGGLTAPLIGRISGVISMVVSVQTGRATSCGGSLTA